MGIQSNMKIIKLVFILLVSSTSFAQTDSCKLQISLITCGQGEELYSIFGHSAIRVKEISTGRDIIFNYGTFDFDDPDFYAKFLKEIYCISYRQVHSMTSFTNINMKEEV